METILRVFQVFLALGLIGVVLLQRSEGGGLGIGSSGGAGSFMSVRGTANFLTRVTSILAALFMATCLALAIIAKPSAGPHSIFDVPPPRPASTNEIPAPVQTAPEPSPAPVPAVQPAPAESAAPAPVVTPVPAAPILPAPTAATPVPVPVPPAAAPPAQAPAPAPAKPAAAVKPKHKHPLHSGTAPADDQ